MELPKHTTQVGTIAAQKKLYIEDYCISYMKQLCEEHPEERKQIALFGNLERDRGVEYAFVYGAALLGCGKGRTDSLSSSQREEAESYRKEFFADRQLIGVVISTDLINENVYWLGNGSKSIPMDGYYIFYDENESMLDFMMKNPREEREVDLDPVIVKKADMDRERRERAEQAVAEAQQKRGVYRKNLQQAEQNSKPERKRTGRAFPAAACLLVLAIGGVFVAKTYYPQFGYQQVSGYVTGLFEDFAGLSQSVLGEESTDNLLAEQGTESLAAESTESLGDDEDMLIVSADVTKPAELDVFVIPEPDTIVDTPVLPQKPEEPAEEVPVVQEEPVQEYMIQKGDNLLRILRTHYGDESKLREICDVNGIVDPNNIQVGQTILLP